MNFLAMTNTEIVEYVDNMAHPTELEVHLADRLRDATAELSDMAKAAAVAPAPKKGAS